MTYEEFREALKQRESSGDYQVVNSLGYLGAYQFGEAALVDLGFVVHDGNAFDNSITAWTGKMGIDSAAEFLASPAAQDAAADAWFELLWSYAEAFGLDAYLGQTIDGVHVTASAIIAGAHLVGIGGMRDWLESSGTLRLSDAYGTPVEEYLAMFSGYQMPFDTGEAPEDLQLPGPGWHFGWHLIAPGWVWSLGWYKDWDHGWHIDWSWGWHKDWAWGWHIDWSWGWSADWGWSWAWMAGGWVLDRGWSRDWGWVASWDHGWFWSWDHGWSGAWDHGWSWAWAHGWHWAWLSSPAWRHGSYFGWTHGSHGYSWDYHDWAGLV